MLLIKKTFLVFAILILTTFSSFAQMSNSISSVDFGEIKDGNSVKVTASLINSPLISRVQIVYKSFQETDFRIREMEIQGNIAQYQIPPEDVSAPTVSYYLVIELKNGLRETYPLGVPESAQPIELTVSAKSEKDNEILILSPTANETVKLNDLFISISFIKASDEVDISKTKIIFNGVDVTKNTIFSGELLLYYPQNFEKSFNSGNQLLEIKVFNKVGELYHTMQREFIATDLVTSKDLGSGLRYNGNAAGEIRNETFSGTNTLYKNFGLILNAGIGNWKFKGYGYLTSEENENVQPQNRFSVSISNDWLDLRAGDSYPRYNNLLLNGKRVRGVDGKLDYGIFHLQGTYGEVRREIEGSLIQTYSEDSAPLQSNVVRIDSTKYGAPFGMIDFGNNSRKLLSARLGLGSRNGFEFGVSFLHSKDDVKSVEFGSKPEENLVASSDLRLAIDNQRIVLKGVGAISVFNSDITSGTYSDSQIDSIFSASDELGNDVENFKNIKNKISEFFTVNQLIEPINFTELSSLAAEGSLELNYFNNNLKSSYIYRGNQFTSFGQEYTRTDIAGINISDRFRTFDNQLFLTLGYENLSDNLQAIKKSTTNFQTLRVSIALFMRQNIPNITLSYIQNKNSNDINPNDSLNGILFLSDKTDRISLNMGYDFNFKIRHSSSLSFATSNRNDESVFNNDAQYFSTSFNLNSFWTKSLVSNFNLIYYNSEIDTIKYKYVTISAGGRYKMLNENLELTFNYSPSFGDFNRHAIDFTAAYQIIQNLWIRAQMRYYKIPDSSTSTISGVTMRYNF